MESSVDCFTNVLDSATHKFVPTCVPKLCCPTPWWNRHCEVAWQEKMKLWHIADGNGFHLASLNAAHVYSRAFQNYQTRLRTTLRNCTGSKQWWSLLTSLTGCRSRGRPAVPSAAQLADYFSSKLSYSSPSSEPPVLEECHHSLLRQFRIKKSRIQSLLCSLDVTKSIGDDGLSPRVLKRCAQPLSGPLTSLFRKICRQSIFPASWKLVVSLQFLKGAQD